MERVVFVYVLADDLIVGFFLIYALYCKPGGFFLVLGERVFLRQLVGTVRLEEGTITCSSLFGNKPQDFSLYVLTVLADLIGNHELQNI